MQDHHLVSLGWAAALAALDDSAGYLFSPLLLSSELTARVSDPTECTNTNC